jgi:beta-galactosidase/beta-glucuronidase
MKTKCYYLIVLVLLFGLPIFAQRDTISLNKNWQFKIDKLGEGNEKQWYSQNWIDARIVNVPHTWNIEKENEMTTKEFSTTELSRLANKEAEARKRMQASGAGMEAAAEYKAETISAMWTRVLARLKAEGANK